MVKEADLRSCDIEHYRELSESSYFEEIFSLAKNLKGKKIVHINSTFSGGGVAELLNTLVPLMDCVGIDARWFYLEKNDQFFSLTKEIHNFLQGKKGELTKDQKSLYHQVSQQIAQDLEKIDADVWVFHDPQPAGALNFMRKPKHTVWRSHIDTSRTNKKVWQWLLPNLKKFDSYIFSMRKYIGDGIDYKKSHIVHPAIDPLNPKNSDMDEKEVEKIISKFSIDPNRPLISQISRFDPWKDPWGVIDTYRLAKKKFPNVQLALIGSFSADDPESKGVIVELQKYAGKDKGIHILSNLDGVHDREVNAFQRGSDVVIQKSIREGFGMTVAEAMWKETPVIGGKTGGIVEQIEDGVNGFLITTVEEAADRVVQILQDENLAKRLGKKGKETVRRKFLLPRLMRDHLKIYSELLRN